MKLLYLLFPLSLFSTEWAYLYSKAFQSRYAIADFYLKDCEEIIEIGGYKTPISQFTKDKIVTVIDPIMQPLQQGTITHLACTWQEWKGKPQTSSYGVVILGLDLNNMCNEDWERLYDLINGSKISVLETPATYEPGMEKLQQVLDHTHKTVSVRLQLDFSGSDFGDLSDSWPPFPKRLLLVLE